MSSADNLYNQFGSRSRFVGLDLDPNCFVRDSDGIVPERIFGKVDLTLKVPRKKCI